MACHVIEEARQGILDRQKIDDALQELESLAGSDKFDVRICACKTCGQRYIYCFREFNSLQFEDYYWNFWVPVSDNDIAELKKTGIDCKPMADIIEARAHICLDDKKRMFWCEHGNPIAHTIFTLPYIVDYPPGYSDHF